MRKVEIACIIDDDPIFIFGTKRMMELAHFCNAFLIYHNGKEAIDGLNAIIKNSERLPDVILLDLNMPIMDGWEFLDEMVKIHVPRQVHVYIVTSSIDPVDTQRAMDYSNVSNYIVKPITIEKLREILHEL